MSDYDKVKPHVLSSHPRNDWKTECCNAEVLVCVCRGMIGTLAIDVDIHVCTACGNMIGDFVPPEPKTRK